MSPPWTGITDAVRSSDPEQVNDAIDRLKELDREQRLQLFDTGFEDLISIYETSEDGYVRQSVVRVVEQITPGLAIVFLLVDEGDPAEGTTDDLTRRLDTAAGFLLEALQDEDGRVRQSAKRALKDVYRGYEALEDTDTIAALASELETLAAEYEGKRRKHLLESKDDAEFFLRPAGSRLIEQIRETASAHDLSNKE